MTLTQLKYLIAVVDNRLNISLAAENLNTSQPGISKQLKLLEEELLATIFVRKGKKLTDTTPFGDEVIFYARKILQDVNNIQYRCTAEMEQDSWPIQKQYLANVHGYHWEYNGLWHLMISQCPTGEYRD